jgi:hypothetical protein
MPRSVTVTFDDGSNHTYDNVPDTVSDDDVQSRASGDFTDKNITGVVQGIAPGSADDQSQPSGAVAPSDLSLTDKAVGAVATAANLAAEHPALAAAAAGAWKANKMANAWTNAQNANAAAQNARTAQMAQTEARVAQRPGFGNVPKAAAPQAPGLVDAAGNPLSSAPQGAPAGAPQAAAQARPIPATSPEAPPSTSNFMSRMSNLAKQYAPAAAEYAGNVGKVVAPIARVLGSAPVLGAQLMSHSEDLNSNEDTLLAEKHALEQRMLSNKQDSEWNKYIQAKAKMAQKSQ